MKNFIIFVTVVFAVNFGFATPDLRPRNERLTIFFTGQISVNEVFKMVRFKDRMVKVFVGIDGNRNISSVQLSNNLSKEEFSLLKTKFLAANCITSCSRANKCSDKPTMAGVIGCYAECTIDCVEKAFEEVQQTQITNLT